MLRIGIGGEDAGGNPLESAVDDFLRVGFAQSFTADEVVAHQAQEVVLLQHTGAGGAFVEHGVEVREEAHDPQVRIFFHDVDQAAVLGGDEADHIGGVGVLHVLQVAGRIVESIGGNDFHGVAQFLGHHVQIGDIELILSAAVQVGQVQDLALALRGCGGYDEGGQEHGQGQDQSQHFFHGFSLLVVSMG